MSRPVLWLAYAAIVASAWLLWWCRARKARSQSATPQPIPSIRLQPSPLDVAATPVVKAQAPVLNVSHLPAGTPTNFGPADTAFWITRHGSVSGAHYTDKLTPDGVLAGFEHNDFGPEMTQCYGTSVDPGLVERVFNTLRSEAYAAVPPDISNPMIVDGHVLRIRSRLDGCEPRVIWLSNTTHPLLTPLIEAVWNARPFPHRSRR